MNASELEELRYNLTRISKVWARDTFSRKDVKKSKEKAVVELVRSPMFLDYMQQVIGKERVTAKPTAKPTKESKVITNELEVPTASIDWDSYLPFKWGVDYVQIGDEAEDLEKFINDGKLPYLIESEKGMGKTLLVTDIALKHNYSLVTLSCSSGTKISELEGRIHVNESGSYFQLGIIPLAIELANHTGHAVLFLDEINALDPELQKRLNPVLDERKSIFVNGKLYRLKDGCVLSIVAAMNPLSYSGVNTLNEDTKSRFVGRTWEHSVEEQLDNVVDWTDISDSHKQQVITLSKSLRDLRKAGDIGYSLSTRDIKQLLEVVNMYKAHYKSSTSVSEIEDKSFVKGITTTIINHKFDNDEERSHVKKLVYDVFGYEIK